MSILRALRATSYCKPYPVLLFVVWLTVFTTMAPLLVSGNDNRPKHEAIALADVDMNTTAPPQPRVPKQRPPPQGGSASMTLIIILVVLGLLFAVGGLFFCAKRFNRKRKPKETTAAPPVVGTVVVESPSATVAAGGNSSTAEAESTILTSHSDVFFGPSLASAGSARLVSNRRSMGISGGGGSYHERYRRAQSMRQREENMQRLADMERRSSTTINTSSGTFTDSNTTYGATASASATRGASFVVDHRHGGRVRPVPVADLQGSVFGDDAEGEEEEEVEQPVYVGRRGNAQLLHVQEQPPQPERDVASEGECSPSNTTRKSASCAPCQGPGSSSNMDEDEEDAISVEINDDDI